MKIPFEIIKLPKGSLRGRKKTIKKRRFTKEEVRQWCKENRGFGYFNKEDRNIFVNREYGIGWSPNWANPLCYIVIAALAGIVIAIELLFE